MTVELEVGLQVQRPLHVSDRKEVSDLWPDAEDARLDRTKNGSGPAVGRNLIVDIANAKAAQRAGIEHAKLNDDRAYLGRKPSFTRQQLDTARGILGQQAVGVAQIAKTTGLGRQTVYRIKDNPESPEAALVAWGL